MADSLATPSETSDPNTPENSDLNPQIPSDAASKHMGCVHTPARLELLSDVLMAQDVVLQYGMVLKNGESCRVPHGIRKACQGINLIFE